MRMTDEMAMIKLSNIMASDAPDCEKFEQLDALTFEVENYHPRGLAAKVLDVISKVQAKLVTVARAADK